MQWEKLRIWSKQTWIKILLPITSCLILNNLLDIFDSQFSEKEGDNDKTYFACSCEDLQK